MSKRPRSFCFRGIWHSFNSDFPLNSRSNSNFSFLLYFKVNYLVFDFEKLEVYKKAKVFNQSVAAFLKQSNTDRVTHDQLRRASFSIMLNIAEGSARYTNKDKRNFYVIARGSVFECVAIFDYLKDQDLISEDVFSKYYEYLEEMSKMLFALIKGLSKD